MYEVYQCPVSLCLSCRSEIGIVYSNCFLTMTPRGNDDIIYFITIKQSIFNIWTFTYFIFRTVKAEVMFCFVLNGLRFVRLVIRIKCSFRLKVHWQDILEHILVFSTLKSGLVAEGKWFDDEPTVYTKRGYEFVSLIGDKVAIKITRAHHGEMFFCGFSPLLLSNAATCHVPKRDGKHMIY